jgi:hypothetical protein
MDTYKGKSVPKLGDTSRYEVIHRSFERVGYTTAMQIFGSQSEAVFEFDTIVESNQLFQSLATCQHEIYVYWHVLEGILARQEWRLLPLRDGVCERVWVKRYCKHEVSEATCAVEEFIDKLGFGRFEMQVHESES